MSEDKPTTDKTIHVHGKWRTGITLGMVLACLTGGLWSMGLEPAQAMFTAASCYGCLMLSGSVLVLCGALLTAAGKTE